MTSGHTHVLVVAEPGGELVLAHSTRCHNLGRVFLGEVLGAKADALHPRTPQESQAHQVEVRRSITAHSTGANSMMRWTRPAIRWHLPADHVPSGHGLAAPARHGRRRGLGLAHGVPAQLWAGAADLHVRDLDVPELADLHVQDHIASNNTAVPARPL